MHIAFLNPQGNFDPADSYWTEHPDFGGQLVYVKELALAMAEQGHTIDIITRQIINGKWTEFDEQLDAYPCHDKVRIIRIPCGSTAFLPKEELWPHLATDWVDGIIRFYENDTHSLDAVTTHYGDGGLAGAVLCQKTNIPFTFTGHSLGAQKMDKLGVNHDNIVEIDKRFKFRHRIIAERIAMNHAARIIVSTRQEHEEQYSHHVYQGAIDVNKDAARFAIIPPGVNRRVFSPDSTTDDSQIQKRIESAMARDLLGERLNLPLVICSSRLDRKKNHLDLVRAFVQNADLRAKANLAIVVRGLDNPLKEYHQLRGEEQTILRGIVTMMNTHQLWGMITSFPLNSQVELAAAYRIATAKKSVFALTALYEPFGLAPLEAMSCGLPAVVTKNGGPAESMLDHDSCHEYGVLVDPADPVDIAHGLLKVFDSATVWQRYHEAGMERVITRYTWESTATAYLTAIKSTCQQKDEERSNLLPIPKYFYTPTQENDIPLAELSKLYFGVNYPRNNFDFPSKI